MYLFDTDKPKDDEFFLQVEDSNPWENEIVILAKTEVKLKDVLKRDKDEKFGPTALTKVKNVEMGGFFFPARYVAGRDFSKPNAFAWIEKVAMMFKPSPVRERGCGGCRKLPAGLPLVDLNVGIFGEITGTLQEGAPVPEASTTPASPSGTTTTTVPPWTDRQWKYRREGTWNENVWFTKRMWNLPIEKKQIHEKTEKENDLMRKDEPSEGRPISNIFEPNENNSKS